PFSPSATLSPYTTLFRSGHVVAAEVDEHAVRTGGGQRDRWRAAAGVVAAGGVAVEGVHRVTRRDTAAERDRVAGAPVRVGEAEVVARRLAAAGPLPVQAAVRDVAGGVLRVDLREPARDGRRRGCAALVLVVEHDQDDVAGLHPRGSADVRRAAATLRQVGARGDERRGGHV